MSSRSDVKDIMAFCKHMREAIIDEQKAVPDYEKLIKQAERLNMLSGAELIKIRRIVNGIISDEKHHKRELLPIFDKVCPRMAIHRKGVE